MRFSIRGSGLCVTQGIVPEGLHLTCVPSCDAGPYRAVDSVERRSSVRRRRVTFLFGWECS